MTKPSRTQRLRSAFGIAGLAAAMLRRSALKRFPALSLDERLRMLPGTAAGLDASIAIRWNDHHVPFVEAGSERDGAVGLGIVHAHLRLAQMEVMRRIAFGRVAEVVGEPALELDHLMRVIDFPRATAASLALMPDATRAWVEGFADGINAVATAGETPPEFALLGLSPQPWTAEDLFAVSRLCSADYAWRIWRSLSRLRREENWAELWTDLTDLSALADADAPLGPGSPRETVPTAFAPTGSNAYAVAGSRTASGKPILAADPHLLIATPGPWLIAGLSLPDLSLWGIMIPALPIFGMGRNDGGAWGGTNLHATSSELVDVSAEPLEDRSVTIAVAGRRPVTRTLRESAFGPVISDTTLFDMQGETVALHWMGHRPSDEYTPFLKLMRARDWAAFGDAVDGYGVPGLTMIFAGEDGDIGKMTAVRVPSRPLAAPADILTSPDEARAHWGTLLTARSLPQEHNPASGYVASANDEPDGQPVTISLFYAAPHRIERLRELLGDRNDVTREDMVRFQADTFLAPARALALDLAQLAARSRPDSPVRAALAAWDGTYEANSPGALSFELVAEPLIAGLSRRSPDAPASHLSEHWRPFVRLTHLVEAAAGDVLAEALAEAIDSAEAPFARHATWGGLHRLRLGHPLTRLPWLAHRLPTLDLPAGGSNETLMKSAHPFTQKVHATTFGANARFIADLSGPDETYAVLLGGQDGWPGSRTAFDQVGPFRESHYLHLPRRPGPLAAAFARTTAIAPAAAAPADA